MRIAQVGYTGTDGDRDRELALRLWLRRNDPPFARLLRADRAGGALVNDVLDLNGAPPRDFLAEDRRYDLVVTHNLWGYPGLASAADTGATACSPRHSPEAWRERLRGTGARYIFLFGPHFNGGNLDDSIPGYTCYSVPFLSFLDVFAADQGHGPLGAPTRPITTRDMIAARLRGLAELRLNADLDLSYSRVRSAHLARLRDMPRLKTLLLVGTGIADADLELVAQAAGLTTLNLDETRISNAGLAHLKTLAHLECLSLNHTRIDDAGLEHLRGLRNLTWLSLVDTAISDRGLAHLAEIESLRSLLLARTRVTLAGLEGLANALWTRALAGPGAGPGPGPHVPVRPF